jgi:23S rRNA pseudouridine2457 synthase
MYSLFLIEAPNFPLRSMKIRDERHGPTSWVAIIIRAGKFRQVRKMKAAVGLPTLRLISVRIGEVKLENLEVGALKEVLSFT